MLMQGAPGGGGGGAYGGDHVRDQRVESLALTGLPPGNVRTRFQMVPPASSEGGGMRRFSM